MAADYKNWIRRVTAELKEYFFLQEWRLDLAWKDVDSSEKPGLMATIDVDSKYFQATISLYPALESMWDDGEVDRVVETLVHEFSHVLTEPLFDLAWDTASRTSDEFLYKIREQQTQRTALVIIRGLPKSFYKVPVKKRAKSSV